MTGSQKAVLVGTTMGAMLGVFLGAGADASWAALTAPTYILGSVAAGASAVVAFFAKSPKQ